MPPATTTILLLLLTLNPSPGALAAAPTDDAPTPPAIDAPAAAPDAPLALADAPAAERAALDRLLTSASWTKRAIAAVRLQRYGCAESSTLLVGLVRDSAWRVRVFALLVIAQRGEALEPQWLASETEPRVVRAALRCGMKLDTERVSRGAIALLDADNLGDRMLGVEIAAASGDDALAERADEQLRRIILVMNRVEVGVLAPRIALLTGQPMMYRAATWQRWMRAQGRTLPLRTGAMLQRRDGDGRRAASPIAALEPESFAAMGDYMKSLADRRVDLAVCLDCTASMSGEITAAQSGINDLMLFVGDVVAELRVGFVVYRDRRSRDFETKGWDFVSDPDVARQRLWTLSADGGGDAREMVYEALKLAYTKLTWNPEHDRVLVLIGDAAPHVGYGGQCVEMARLAAAGGCVTNVIQTAKDDVQHFPEIAEAGAGRCVRLDEDERLVGEIAGLTLGDRYGDELRDFFETFLVLCR